MQKIYDPQWTPPPNTPSKPKWLANCSTLQTPLIYPPFPTQLPTPLPSPKPHHPTPPPMIMETPTSPYLGASITGTTAQPPPTPSKLIHYGHSQDQQIIIQITHRVMQNAPTYNQEWIDYLFHDMVSNTIIKLESSSKNILGHTWNSVWIPYIKVINVAPTISFATNTTRDKTPIQKSKGLSWKYVRTLFDRANFSKWDTYVTPDARNLNFNAIFMFNGTTEDINNFRRQFQENLMAFHKKSQAWKSKLQPWSEPSKVGHVIYGANNI